MMNQERNISKRLKIWPEKQHEKKLAFHLKLQFIH